MFLKKIIDFFSQSHINSLEMDILVGIKDCLDPKYIDNYAQQIEEINYITRQNNNSEILFYHKERGRVGFSKELKIPNLDKEVVVAKIKIIDLQDREYLIKVWFVNGYIFSFEANRPLKNLNYDNIKSIDYQCVKNKKSNEK